MEEKKRRKKKHKKTKAERPKGRIEQTRQFVFPVQLFACTTLSSLRTSEKG